MGSFKEDICVYSGKWRILLCVKRQGSLHCYQPHSWPGKLCTPSRGMVVSGGVCGIELHVVLWICGKGPSASSVSVTSFCGTQKLKDATLREVGGGLWKQFVVSSLVICLPVTSFPWSGSLATLLLYYSDLWIEQFFSFCWVLY